MVAIMIIGLSWGMIGSKTVEATYWKDTSIQCLPHGHTDLALHIHPRLSMRIDGVEEKVEANIGIVPTCMAEVHTHDASGEIHVETASVGRGSFALEDFFTVWGKTLERDGYSLSATVDGVLVEDPAKITLRDEQGIVLSYTSVVGGGN